MELTVLNDLKIYQPKNGYRFSLEPFVLTNNIDLSKNVIVDFGSGCGIISILLAKRIRECKIYAVETNDDMVSIMKKNISLNDIKNVEIVKDLADIETNSVDLIVSNPPYFLDRHYRESKKFFQEKFETKSLYDLLKDIRRVVRNKGILRLSYHPTRAVQLINTLDSLNFGVKSITPVYGNKNKKASFIIIDSKFNAKHYTVFENAIYLEDFSKNL